MRKIILNLLILIPLSSFAEKAENLDKIIATINDSPLTQSEYNKSLDVAIRELQSRKIPLPKDAELKKQVMKKLIQESLILQLAQNNSIEISDEELNSAINNIATRNNMDIFQFKQAIKNEGMDFDDYRENFRKQILIQNIEGSIANRETSVSEREIEKYLDNMELLPQDKEYHLASILIKSPANPSKEDVDNVNAKIEGLIKKIKAGENFSQLAATNSDAPNALNGGDMGWASLNDFPSELAEKIAKLEIGDFIGPLNSPNGAVILKVIGTKAKQVASNQQVEYKIKQILLKNSGKFSDKDLKEKLENIRAEIIKNNNFDAMAKINSDEIASKNQGGELGWITDKDVVPEFAEAMEHSEKGKITKPFKTQLGWHILVVENKRTVDQSQKLRREQAVATLKQQKSQDTIQKWLNQLEDSAYINYVG